MKIEIINLEKDISNGGVLRVHWHAYETYEHLNNHQISVVGVDEFDPDPTNENFIPFNQLTQADVVGWLEEKEGWLNEVQQDINKQLKMFTPSSTESGVPWL